MLHVVLVQPLNPVNVGNIGRTCLAFGAALHLIRPFPFSLEDRYVRKGGLDYWPSVDLRVHAGWGAFRQDTLPGLGPAYLLSKKERLGQTSLCDVQFPASGSMALVFGNEDKGVSMLDEEELADLARVYVPMTDRVRSLNLANTVALAAFEGVRQRGLSPP